MITVIDSGIANIGSVLAAFDRIGAPTTVTRNPDTVRAADAMVLPGVGAFKDGMDSLRRHGLVEPIRDAVLAGTPVLGICLGMQLLADTSEEFGDHEGLRLIHGRVVRLEPTRPRERVPHIGWCDVSIPAPSRLFAKLPQRATFYFVHSYHLVCARAEDAVGFMDFGAGRVCAAARSGNVFGVQFHPEKSQDAGLAVLESYAELIRERHGQR